MRDYVIMRCIECGNAILADREESDPPGTRFIETNECDICDAANGGFEEVLYYDATGIEIGGHIA